MPIATYGGSLVPGQSHPKCHRIVVTSRRFGRRSGVAPRQFGLLPKIHAPSSTSEYMQPATVRVRVSKAGVQLSEMSADVFRDKPGYTGWGRDFPGSPIEQRCFNISYAGKRTRRVRIFEGVADT